MADDDERAGELWALADLITPMAIRVAATLRIADHIAGGHRSAPALAAIVDADAGVLERLLRHLTTAGVLRPEGAGEYGLTARGEALRTDHPRRLWAVLDTTGAIGRADLSLVHLLHSVRSGEPAYPRQFGRSFWDDLAEDAALSASFDAHQMGVDVTADAPAIVSAYDWGSLGHVIDVGGGNGALLIAILYAFPGLRGTVVDLPGAAAAAQQALLEGGLADRSAVAPGSFFAPLPAGVGGYLLSAILHDWDDDGARAIMRRCAEAAGRGGRVFIIEKIGADGETLRTAMDLRVLAYFGGRERGVTALTTLAAECGLTVAKVDPAGALAIVELVADNTGAGE